MSEESKAEEPPPPGAESDDIEPEVTSQTEDIEEEDIIAGIEAEQPPDYNKVRGQHLPYYQKISILRRKCFVFSVCKILQICRII